MHTSSFGTEQVLLRIIAVLAGIGVLFNTVGDFARADANPLCASPELYDLDGSGMVAPADLLVLIDALNGAVAQSPKFDIDGSGVVDEQDIDALAAGIQACRRNRVAGMKPADSRSVGQVAAVPQVEVTLSPLSPAPYPPGGQVPVVVSLQRVQPGATIPTRLIQFDITVSYVPLGVTYPVTHPLAAAGSITFWDFSSTPICSADPTLCGDLHFLDPSVFLPPDPVVVIVYTGLVLSVARQIAIPGNGSPVNVGLLEVTLPSIPGLYQLDVMNAASPDQNFSAQIYYDFNNTTRLAANEGGISGGILNLPVTLGECVSGFPCDSDGDDCTDDVCIDEVCTHNFSPAGSPCGTQTPQGPCDLDKVCDGAGTCLPPQLAPAGTECRPAIGECDLTERCDGQSPQCPPDMVVAPNTPCSDDGVECTSDACSNGLCRHDLLALGTPCGNPIPQGVCDFPDVCNGAGLCILNYATSTTICRVSVGDCDRAEFCTGQSPGCGQDLFFGAGTPCGDQAPQGACDLPDQCDGAGGCLPNYASPQIVCRPALGECDIDELCTGHAPDCPNNLFRDAGAPCSADGDECTNDVCDGAGQCAHGEIAGCRAIPAVSTWGFVILSLVLMVGAKLRFRIRSPQN